jgi:ribosomal protein L31
MPLQLGGGPKCGVCGMIVYFNEERRAIGKIYHSKCFKCKSCAKNLDSVSCNEHDDLVYCKSCYSKNFGPKGYGFAGGASGLSTAHGQPVGSGIGGGAPAGGLVDKDDPECCPQCGKRVYFAEQILAFRRKWHKVCFKCNTCKKSMDLNNCTEHEELPYCKGCYAKNFGPKGYGFAGGASGLSTVHGQPHTSNPAGLPSQNGQTDKDDPESCPRCGKSVYFAEQVLSLNRKWHKMCFKCVSCSKTVDIGSATDHDGELYCKGCHGRHFGIKGVGYGVGAGTLMSV